MKLVILNGQEDTAGVGIGLKQAFDKYAVGWETRSICRQETYLGYPTDIVWPLSLPGPTPEVKDLVRQADVIHVMDSERVLRYFRGNLKGKRTVVHHLGTRYRRNPKASTTACQAYGATEVTDSLDLMLYPHVGFLPTPIGTDALAKLRTERYEPSQKLRIAHAPTHRAVKSTDKIIEAVESLARRYPIDFDLIEGVSNAECLARKARADIFVDQLLLGFGVNNIECWAMGIPVVSGLVDAEARSKALAMFGQLPWADATERTLEAVIEHLILDAEWRTELGVRGKVHAERWHSQESVVRQTLQVYEQAGAEVAA